MFEYNFSQQYPTGHNLKLNNFIFFLQFNVKHAVISVYKLQRIT